MRRARALLAGLLICGAAGAITEIAGQARPPGPLVASSLDPGAVRIGEPFVLSLAVELPVAAQVRFPAVLDLPDDLEQRGPVVIDSEDGGRVWRAAYELVAWTVDSIAIPTIEAAIEPDGGEPSELLLTGPTAAVTGVLPDEEGLELREARPFLRVRTFPWWILALLAVAAAGVAWWMMRRRAPAAAGAAVPGPGGLALADFERIRGEWRAGRLTQDQFFDRFERALRRYVRATRRWAAHRGLLGMSSSSGGLRDALQLSLIIRFARVRGRREGPEIALDAGEAFVRSDMAEIADAGEDAGGAAGTGERTGAGADERDDEAAGGTP